MKKIVNLTPHEINIIGDINITILPSGIVTRVSETIEIIDNINGIPIIHKVFGTIENLPDLEKDTIFIVSLLVAQIVKRSDILTIGETVRNDKGQVIGAKSLAII